MKKHNLAERVLFSSFNPIALLRIHRILPLVPIGLLAFKGSKGYWARSWLGELIRYQSLHIATEDVEASLIDRIHRQGRRLLVYTVNQAEDMRRLFHIGVDGIFTDDPLTAKRILSASSEQHMKNKEA